MQTLRNLFKVYRKKKVVFYAKFACFHVRWLKIARDPACVFISVVHKLSTLERNGIAVQTQNIAELVMRTNLVIWRLPLTHIFTAKPFIYIFFHMHEFFKSFSRILAQPQYHCRREEKIEKKTIENCGWGPKIMHSVEHFIWLVCYWNFLFCRCLLTKKNTVHTISKIVALKIATFQYLPYNKTTYLQLSLHRKRLYA